MSAWRLTKLGRFAQDEGVRPELADGSVVEALVTDGASEAAAPQDVGHVAAGPYCSHNAANTTTEEETDVSPGTAAACHVVEVAQSG